MMVLTSEQDKALSYWQYYWFDDDSMPEDSHHVPSLDTAYQTLRALGFPVVYDRSQTSRVRPCYRIDAP